MDANNGARNVETRSRRAVFRCGQNRVFDVGVSSEARGGWETYQETKSAQLVISYIGVNGEPLCSGANAVWVSAEYPRR